MRKVYIFLFTGEKWRLCFYPKPHTLILMAKKKKLKWQRRNWETEDGLIHHPFCLLSVWKGWKAVDFIWTASLAARLLHILGDIWEIGMGQRSCPNETGKGPVVLAISMSSACLLPVGNFGQRISLIREMRNAETKENIRGDQIIIM